MSNQTDSKFLDNIIRKCLKSNDKNKIKAAYDCICIDGYKNKKLAFEVSMKYNEFIKKTK